MTSGKGQQSYSAEQIVCKRIHSIVAGGEVLVANVGEHLSVVGRPGLAGEERRLHLDKRRRGGEA